MPLMMGGALIGRVTDRPDSTIGPVGAQSRGDWENPSFHGSVHTATMAVCTVLVLFVVVLGIFGNGLVLLSALRCGDGRRRPRMRSTFDLLVYSLAGADFFVCTFLAPTFLYLLFAAAPPVESSREICGSFFFIGTLCSLVSLLTLVAIAVYRQSRVTGNVKVALTMRRTVSIMAAIFIVSISTALGGTLHLTLTWENSQTCQRVLKGGDPTSTNAVLFFVGPVVLISCVTIFVCYCIIARAVRAQTYQRVKALQPLLQEFSWYSKLASPPAESAPMPSKDNHGSVFLLGSDPELRQIQAGGNLPVIGPPTLVTNLSSTPQCPVPETSLTTTSTKTSFIKRLWTRCFGNSASGLGKTPSQAIRHCSCCSCGTALDKENKAVSMCLVILIILLCWTPLVASHAIELLTGNPIVLYQVKLCGVALIFFNSALNPYLYAQNCGRHSSSFLWDVFRCECRLPCPKRTRLNSYRRPSLQHCSQPEDIALLLRPGLAQ